MIELEKEFLNNLYNTYTVSHCKQTQIMRELTIKTFSPYLKAGKALELGCSDGYMTEMISQFVDQLDVVDGSELFLSKAKQRAADQHIVNVNFHLSLFEEFHSAEKFDYVIASFVLEHVLDPIEVMKMACNALKDDGLLFIVVPNANALSRQLAMHMGFYSNLKELTKNDLNHGHRRVYDRVDLNRDIEKAGFDNIAQGGIMLKILADFQMNQLIESEILSQAQIDGLYKLGLEYPDLSGALFSICKKKT